MATGILLPAKTENGRLLKLSGDDYIEQLVMIGLLGNQSDNPFQDIGLGDFIFEINDGVSEGEIRAQIVTMFEILERDQLAALEDPDSDLSFSRVEGELFAELTYTNLETQERPEISVPIPPAGE